MATGDIRTDYGRGADGTIDRAEFADRFFLK